MYDQETIKRIINSVVQTCKIISDGDKEKFRTCVEGSWRSILIFGEKAGETREDREFARIVADSLKGVLKNI